MRNPNFIDGLPDEATAAKALAHPLRRRLLDALHARGAMSSRELTEIVGVDSQRVNHHMKTLVTAGFAEIEDESRQRNAVEYIYRAKLQARVEVWTATGRQPSAG